MKAAVKRASDQGTSKSAIVKKSKFAQRQTQRSRRVPRNLTSVNLGLGFPKRMVITHKYDEFQDFTSTLGVIAKAGWVCNGLYDPNPAVGGHQPMYFDNLMAVYDHYHVIGSKITVHVSPTDPSGQGFFFGGWVDDDNSHSNVSGMSAISEQTTGRVVQFAGGALDTKVLTFSWSAKRTFGGSILGNTELQGNAGANPTETAYFVLGIQGFSTGSNVTAKVRVTIEYVTVYSELRDQAAN